MQKPLDSYLDKADAAGSVLAHARLLIRLTRLYQEIAPPHLGRSSHLANYKSGSMVIHAANGAVAAKLRQLAPTLAAGFCKRGVECSDVQVKVQAAESSKQSMTSTQKPLSSKASHGLEDLRDTLPESSLRRALEVFLTRVAKQE